MKSLSEIYKETNNSTANLQAISYKGLSNEQIYELSTHGQSHYKGKVRELIINDNYIDIIHTDQLSAFDRFIGMVPYKGVLLADIASRWFEICSDNEIPNHYLERPHPRIMRAEKLTPFKVEVVVRNYMAGSMARSYKEGVRNFCGNILPEGLMEFAKLETPIITPTTKAEAFEHDEETTQEQLIERKICTLDEWNTIKQLSFALFELGTKKYEEIGYILVDTKYEFGKNKDGQIKVIDEIHTPDSSRLWVKSSYKERFSKGESPQMLDKENIRRSLISDGFSGEGEVPEVDNSEFISLGETYLKVRDQLIDQKLMINQESINRPIT